MGVTDGVDKNVLQNTQSLFKFQGDERQEKLPKSKYIVKLNNGIYILRLLLTESMRLILHLLSLFSLVNRVCSGWCFIDSLCI